jgi:hypothetical protein
VRLLVRLLGPLEVECAGRPVPIGAAKERLVVVVLALNAGRVVPVDRSAARSNGPAGGIGPVWSRGLLYLLFTAAVSAILLRPERRAGCSVGHQ